MLRKQESELEQLKNQVKELYCELNELKLKLKSNKTEKLSNNKNENGYKWGNKFGKEIGAILISPNIKNSLNDRLNAKQIYKLFSSVMGSKIDIPNSFGLSKSQQHYQQAQSFKNIAHKL